MPVMSANQEKIIEVASADTQVDSVPRRASLLVKFIVIMLVIVGVSWLFSSLRQREVVEDVDADKNAAGSYASFESAVDGVSIYTLSGVSFIFEPQQANEAGVISTRVRLELNDLKRGATPIEVGRYRLGTYRGSCRAFSIEEYDALNIGESRPLAFSECAHAGVARQLGVFQEGSNLVVKARSNVGEGVFDQLVPILSIDVTQIVE